LLRKINHWVWLRSLTNTLFALMTFVMLFRKATTLIYVWKGFVSSFVSQTPTSCLRTYLLTYYMEQIPSSELNRFAVSQEIHRIL
jgi:hypothetical protein